MAKITVFVNGKARQMEAGQGMAGLLEELGLAPQMILVEHNQRALLRTEWPELVLEHGDRLEIIRVVAGG
ncbi:MAG: sulfur carrier protein ThiS [Blastochloris sp.]|nr:sulfur carrier protein ThiS [Blastochloris sp.]